VALWRSAQHPPYNLRSATLARCATGHDRPESPVTIAGIRSSHTFDYEALAYPDTDSHRAVNAPSRAHLERRPRSECCLHSQKTVMSRLDPISVMTPFPISLASPLGISQKEGPTDNSWAYGIWWSWRDLNPRPQAIFEQIYMFSGLI
jgi:hypothetical protein